MPSLKRTAEPDTFDLGKSVTMVISKAKELHKTINGQLDQLDYIESRKKQEEQDLERVINEKGDVIKLKKELTDQIIAKKSEFLEFIGSKQQEIEDRQKLLAQQETDFSTQKTKDEESIAITKNELGIRSNELENAILNARETVKAELTDDIQAVKNREVKLDGREKALITGQNDLETNRRDLSNQTEKIGETQQKLADYRVKLDNKEAQLTLREKNIVTKELKLIDREKGILQMVTDLEGQLSLIKREKSKNEHDSQAIKDMMISLDRRKKDLDDREIHISDREATKATH